MTTANRQPKQVELLGPEDESIDPLLEHLSEWMDSKFEIPGLGWRFGLDAILGLFPGVGDTISFVVSCYILSAAARHGIPRITIARMGMNVAIDLAIGCIPFIGDIFDVAWKANTRNVELLKRTLESPINQRQRAKWTDWAFVIGGMTLLFVGMVTVVGLIWTAIGWAISQISG